VPDVVLGEAVRIAMISARLYPEVTWEPQVVPGYEVVCWRSDDYTFPPRERAMLPRLQARLPKCFGWEMVPGADIYVWCDASFAIERGDAVAWLINRLDDFVCFVHPERGSIHAEAEFLRERARSTYIWKRYAGERLEEQLGILTDEGYEDNVLYAGGVFAYRDSKPMRAALTDWWLNQSKYHLNDQLSLPYVLWKHRLRVSTVPGNIFENPYFIHTRNRQWKVAHASPPADQLPGAVV
jgi:hypothetical protein